MNHFRYNIKMIIIIVIAYNDDVPKNMQSILVSVRSSLDKLTGCRVTDRLSALTGVIL